MQDIHAIGDAWIATGWYSSRGARVSRAVAIEFASATRFMRER
jgi:hypothetical protein